MKREISNCIKKAIKDFQEAKKWPSFTIPEIIVDHPKDEKLGDYTTNIAMVLARILKKKPLDVANDLIRSLDFARDDNMGNYFEKIEAVEPGYINFYLSKKYLQKRIAEINRDKQKYGNNNLGKGIKVNNEFISANPTGPLHLGNGRGGFYGDALSNVLEKSSYDVTKEYYVNNVGEQTIKFAQSFKEDERAVYSGEYIGELRRKKSELIDKPVEVSAPPLADAVMEDFIKPAIEKMGIKDVNYVWEDDLYDKNYIEKTFKILEDKNLIYKKDGASWFKSTDFGDDKDRVLIKKNGNKTYFASDCGYILYKIENKFSKIIEIWGADHHGYIKRFEAAARALKFKGDLRFIIVQLVRLVKNGKEARMSKRAGNVVYIDDLIKEVGLDAARFFFLMYAPDTHMNFDLDLAKERSEKNPVYYVQYAHARISSILRKSEEIFGGSTSKWRLNLLTHKKELSLMRELNKFPELIEEIAKNYEVHKLPHYAIKLADKFHNFYEECRVIDEKNPELTGARRNLVNAVRIVLAEALRLMGVSAPERM